METRSGIKKTRGIIMGLELEQEETGAVRNRNLKEDPLKNDLIMDNIFKHCTPRMISGCRLVSKKWYSASLPVWNSGRGRPIKLVCKRKPRRCRRGGGGGGGEDDDDGPCMFDFVQDFHIIIGGQTSSPEISGMSQYKSFHLVLDKSFKSRGSPLDLFWNGAGPWITSLKISYSGPLDVPFFSQLLMCDLTPQLQELDLEICREDKDFGDEVDKMSLQKQWGWGSGQRFQEGRTNNGLKSLRLAEEAHVLLVDWKAYLGCCPKLEKLDLSGCCWIVKNDLDDLWRAIKEIRAEDKTKLCLKSLSLWKVGCERNGFSHLRRLPPLSSNLLKDLKLALESLSINFGIGVDSNNVQQLCTMYSKSLKELSIFHFAPLESSPFSGMSMTHLVSLVVEGIGFSRLNLSFLRGMPVLQSLNLRERSPQVGFRVYTGSPIPWSSKLWNKLISATKEEDMEGVVIPSMSSFICDYPGVFDSTDLSRLHDWMPNLVRLGLKLDNESFPTVCGLWPNLTHVTNFGGRLGDRGIVGLETSSDGVATFNEPNITNLQDLRSFVYGGWVGVARCEEGDRKLTVRSVQHGLSKLTALEKVQIVHKAAPDDHEEIEEGIRAMMPFVKVESPHQIHWVKKITT